MKMKKIISVLLTVAVAAGMMSGCKGKNTLDSEKKRKSNGCFMGKPNA